MEKEGVAKALSPGAHQTWWVLSWLPGPAPLAALEGIGEVSAGELMDELAATGVVSATETAGETWYGLAKGAADRGDGADGVAGKAPESLVREDVLTGVGRRCLEIAAGEMSKGAAGDGERASGVLDLGLRCLAEAGDTEQLQEAATILLDGAGGERLIRRGR